MDIYTILSTIFKYSLLALGGIAILIPLYAAGFLIYKKVFHGTKKMEAETVYEDGSTAASLWRQYLLCDPCLSKSGIR